MEDLPERVVATERPYVKRLRLDGRHRMRHVETEWYLSSREDASFTMLGQPMSAGAF